MHAPRKAMWRHSKKVTICKPGGENSTVLTSWSQTLNFQNFDKINFCCFSHPDYNILLWQPEQAKTYGYTTVCFFHSHGYLMDISRFWLLQIQLLRTVVYKSLRGHLLSFLLIKNLGVDWPGVVLLFRNYQIIFWGDYTILCSHQQHTRVLISPH